MGRNWSTKQHHTGFSVIEVLLVIVVVGVLAASGLVIYQHHKPSSAMNDITTSHLRTTTPSQGTTTTPTQQTMMAYLTIKEWGVKMPLSAAIKDAYYVVPTGISLDADKRPSAILLGLTSRNSSCGTVAPDGSGYANSFGEIVRALPTDKDPVSDKLYTELLPGGTTIGNYYYGYSSNVKSKTCVPQSTLESIDSAFVTAAKGIVATTN